MKKLCDLVKHGIKSANSVPKKDKYDDLTLTYSVKSAPLDFPPLGAVKGCDAKFLICQKWLWNVAVEDLSQSQCPRHRGVVHTQKTFGVNADDGRLMTTEGQDNSADSHRLQEGSERA